jgi:parallel beta-helix repeat protein
MLRATPLILLLCLSLHAAAEPTVLRVPADYPTLAAAVDAAAPGDTVALSAGKHEQPAQLLVAKPLRIQGEAADTTFIQTTLAKDELIKVDKVDGFAIEKVTVEYTGPPPPPDRTEFPSLLSVFGGRAEIENCTFRNSSGFGVIFKQGANGTIRHCRAENNLTIGIYVKEAGTVVTVTDNDALKNGSVGIMAYQGATATVEGNRCVENAENGITVTECAAGETVVRGNTCDKNRKHGIRASINSRVLMADNTCRENAEGGVVIDTGSSGTVSGNTCGGNLHGIAVSSVGTTATVEGNTCSGNTEAGIAVAYGAKATVRKNTCSDNPGAGIWVSRWETSAELLDNICNANKNSGISVNQGGHAVVRGNECTGNAFCGLFASDEESRAEFGENRLGDNGKGDSVTEAGIPGRLQYQVRNYEIGSAFMRGHVDYLERITARLRKYQSRYPDGGWQLYYFYDGLLHGNNGFNVNKRPDFRVALEKWAAEYPDSSTPRIALVMAHRDYAWDARGTGWASEVTPEGWKGFKEHLDTAEKWCADAESKPDKDPYLYAAWVVVAMGQCASNERIRELMDKGMEIDPACYTLYSAVCATLWPRWGGSKEEIVQFFDEVHARTKEKMGEKMYTFVVDGQFCPGAVYGDLADWNLVKAGFDQILEEFPQSWYYLNRYCMLACVFGDKEKARALFEKIGDNPDITAWVNKEANYRGARRWAQSDGPLPEFFQVDGRPPGNADERPDGPVPALSAIAGLSQKQIAFGLLAVSLSMAMVTVMVIVLIVYLSGKRGSGRGGARR